MLGDTESEVTGLGEVALAELVLLDLEATLEDLLSLGATDGDVDGDLFVTTDTEGTDGVTGLGVDGGLTGKLLKHLGGTGESDMKVSQKKRSHSNSTECELPITRLSDGDVEGQLAETQRPVGVLGLGGSGLHYVRIAIRDLK